MFLRNGAVCMTVLLTACKFSTPGASEVKNQNASDAAASTGNFFESGFTIKIEQGTSASKTVIVEDGQGKLLSENKLPDVGLSLDQGTSPEGDVIFAWPHASEAIERNYERVGELIREYGVLVGTLVGRKAEGAGEKSWSQYLRSKQGAAVETARMSALKQEKNSKDPFAVRNVTTKWCSEVVNQFVDGLVPSGSNYRQYGNCGEGGMIGACLAVRANFREDEIRVCASANDHFFAMVKRGQEGETNQRWCLMDRWPDGPMREINGDVPQLIGNFTCGVDIDEVAHTVTLNGEPVPKKMSWFKRATCATLDSYLTDVNGFYARVNSL